MSAIFGEVLTLGQANGPDVKLVVFGDEFYARYETLGGYTVVYDTDLGQYCYAMVTEGRFVSSGVPMSKSAPPELRRHLKEAPDVRNEKFQKRFFPWQTSGNAAAAHVMRTLGANNGLLEGRRVSEGKVRGLTVLVEFPDVPAAVTATDVDAMLNGDNYQANGNFCSVRQYFRLMSGGKLDYTNVVVGPVKLSHKRSYYATVLMVQEALDIVVNSLKVDLAQFDSRQEGMLDAVSFLYAGRTAYEGDLWPHNHWIALSYGAVKTHFYMLTSMGRESVDLSIGTFCHETGHLLCRFPDLYDYGQRDGDFEASAGIGEYCLMGCGNHLNRGRTPAALCAYLRDLVDWCTKTVSLNSPAEYEARHGDYATVARFETVKPNEYFVVENRSQAGIDAYLPSGGLAIYHCDRLGSNEWQGGTPSRHYQCGLLQADGHLDLEHNRNTGDSTDLYKQTDGVAISHDTVPTSRLWDGSDSGLSVSDVSAPRPVIRFRTGPKAAGLVAGGEAHPDLLIPDKDPKGVSHAIPVPQVGDVKSIRVTVDIIHPCISDLVVTLTAPSGKRAILHERAGSDGADLRQTYDIKLVPALAVLTGEPIAGPWTLHVVDLTVENTGRVNAWTIEIEYTTTERVIQGHVTPNLAIPDANPEGASSTLAISEKGTAKDVAVDVEITHTFIGDLVVEVISPSGQSAILHNRVGGSRRNLKMTYDKSSAPALASLVGQQAQGNWTLRVRDLDARDVGTLARWGLKVTC